MRFTVVVSNPRISMMNTHNATNADLGAALDDGSSMVQTGGTLGSTNLAYHSPPANIAVLWCSPIGWPQPSQ